MLLQEISSIVSVLLQLISESFWQQKKWSAVWDDIVYVQDFRMPLVFFTVYKSLVGLMYFKWTNNDILLLRDMITLLRKRNMLSSQRNISFEQLVSPSSIRWFQFIYITFPSGIINIVDINGALSFFFVKHQCRWQQMNNSYIMTMIMSKNRNYSHIKRTFCSLLMRFASLHLNPIEIKVK